MTNQKLYDDILLEHNLHPRHQGELSNATFRATATNSSCGDELTISLNLKNGKVLDGCWSGRGCAISQASADILLTVLLSNDPSELKALDTVFRMPARLDCALLPFKAIKSAPIDFNFPDPA